MTNKMDYEVVGLSTVPPSPYKDKWQKTFEEAYKKIGTGQVLRFVTEGYKASSLWNSWNRFCLKKQLTPHYRQKLQSSGKTIVWLWFGPKESEESQLHNLLRKDDID
jgi:hypothetical protein